MSAAQLDADCGGRMLDALVRYHDFSGRSSRSEYWSFQFLFVLVNGLLAAVFVWAANTSHERSGADLSNVEIVILLLAALFDASMIVPQAAALTRRLHDVGRTASWLLLLLLPLGVLVIFAFTLADSTIGQNRYGADPKRRTPLYSQY
jgi:uncharacterized membrane protein YhaH (DUF805 family)